MCLLTAFALRGTRYLVSVNAELAEAREELARNAVAEERLRFARDLHDLLGHSLSLIALKSELAGRLAERDPARARAEMADVEAAARRALAEVRDAVSGYRQVSFAQALAEARSALSAAGIALRAPARRCRCPARWTRVLGWVVREATTNVLRHSGAATGHRRARADGRDGVVLDRHRRRPRRAGGAAGSRAVRAGRAGRRRSAAGWRPGPAGGGGFRLRPPCRCRGGRRSVAPVIRVLVAEDQTLVRGALRALLDLEDDIEVVAEVGRGDEVVAAAREHRPDVALLDIEMPGGDGIEAARALATAVPGCRAVILTTFGRPGFLRRAMEVGAAGFLVKDAPGRRARRGRSGR